MRVSVILLVLWALVLSVVSQNTATNLYQDCTYTDPSGASYDLTPMVVNLTSSTTVSQLYSGVDASGYKYYANICNVVSSDTGCSASSQTPVCQANSSGAQVAPCGVVSSQQFKPSNDTWAPDGGVAVWYTNGPVCSNGVHSNRTSIIHVSCGDGTSLAMTSVEEDYCWYDIYLTSEYACPTNTAPSPSGLIGTATVSSWSYMYTPDIYFAQVPGFDISGTTVSSNGNETTITGYVNGFVMEYSDDAPFYIEQVLSDTSYSTSWGPCNFGEPCDLGSLTLMLVLEGDLSDTPEGPTVCLQNIAKFQVDDGAKVLVEDDCLIMTDAAQLAALTGTLKEAGGDTTVSDFQFWPSTAKLTYKIAKHDIYVTQQCSVDDDDATCEVIDPFALSSSTDDANGGSFVSTLMEMMAEFVSAFRQ